MSPFKHKHRVKERPPDDYYSTPPSLIWVVADLIHEMFPRDQPVLEPCDGEGAITEALRGLGYTVVANDLTPRRPGVSAGNYLDRRSPLYSLRYVITNPPFSLWTGFVTTAKRHCDRALVIGRLNYLATAGRLRLGVWTHLKQIVVFNRYVDFQTPYRTDGQFCTGSMATGWFLWDMSYFGPITIRMVDVEKYATLGRFADGPAPMVSHPTLWSGFQD